MKQAESVALTYRYFSSLDRPTRHRWRLILGCPTDLTIAKFNRSEQIKAEANERDEKLMPQVKESLASQIRALVAKGDRFGAARLCAKQLKTDLLTAREVVARVSGED